MPSCMVECGVWNQGQCGPSGSPLIKGLDRVKLWASVCASGSTTGIRLIKQELQSLLLNVCVSDGGRSVATPGLGVPKCTSKVGQVGVQVIHGAQEKLGRVCA